MDTESYIQLKKAFQNAFLEYIDKEDIIEEYYTNLIEIISDQNIANNIYELKLFLHLIVSISNYHHRHSNFFPKIEKIILFFENNIKNFFSNLEIFKIFKSNKRILLFLFERGILVVDKDIVQIISSKKYVGKNYHYYFYPEIKDFLNESEKEKIIKEIPDNLEENRKIGENPNYICQLIRKDMIDEFISYVNLKNIPLNTNINESFFETNLFLIDKNPTLIEYSAFFGATQIFKYLFLNNAKTDTYICFYSIFGDDEELFHIIEEKYLSKLTSISNNIYNFSLLLNYSIEAHHIDMTNYILTNFIDGIESFNMNDAYHSSFKSYNFSFLPKDFVEKSFRFYLIKYDYYTIFEILLKNKNLDINERKILQ